MEGDGGVTSVKVTPERTPQSREREWVIRRGKKSSRGTSKAKTLRQEEPCIQWDICKKLFSSGLKKACAADDDGDDDSDDGDDGDGGGDGDDGDGGGDDLNDNPTTEYKGCENRHSPC